MQTDFCVRHVPGRLADTQSALSGFASSIRPSPFASHSGRDIQGLRMMDVKSAEAIVVATLYDARFGKHTRYDVATGPHVQQIEAVEWASDTAMRYLSQVITRRSTGRCIIVPVFDTPVPTHHLTRFQVQATDHPFFRYGAPYNDIPALFALVRPLRKEEKIDLSIGECYGYVVMADGGVIDGRLTVNGGSFNNWQIDEY